MKGYAALPTCKEGSIFGPSHNDGVKSFFVIGSSQMLCFEIEALTALSDLEQLEGVMEGVHGIEGSGICGSSIPLCAGPAPVSDHQAYADCRSDSALGGESFCFVGINNTCCCRGSQGFLGV